MHVKNLELVLFLHLLKKMYWGLNVLRNRAKYTFHLFISYCQKSYELICFLYSFSIVEKIDLQNSQCLDVAIGVTTQSKSRSNLP